MMRLFVFSLIFASLGLGSPQIAAAQSTTQERGPEYVLESGDSVEVTYTYTPEYNQTVTIPSDGAVGLTRVGSVQIRGLTLRAATAAITEAASRSGLNKPEVFLTLRDFVRPQFTVLGEVNKPGKYELHGTQRIADGIAIAGGLNLNARHKYIILIHPISPTEGETALFNYKLLEKKNSPVTLETLQDGDIIVVPQGTFSKIERIVKLANAGIYYPL
jgi:polysaccharide biosynthesis/export protein